ncbi:MAG: hypothetical protein M3Y03_03060 [Verrucomicrobiota bacterium]|nr:hypothetical protein [Verrucomicrobiota bacterium]
MTLEFRPEEGAVFDLSNRAKLRISGADRLRYLNGQISNDLRKAAPDRAIHACVLSVKGKINAEVFIVSEADSFLLDTDPEMGEQLAARLERYIIADDVQVADVTEEFGLFHVVGADLALLPKGNIVAEAERFGRRGVDLWIPRAEREGTLRELATRWPICDEACAEAFRIEQGLPRWGRELTDEIIPTEANLEASAIDYAKGCYIGQEVISRIKMSGQTNKRLCGFVAVTPIPLSAGMRLTNASGEAKEVGWLTSTTESTRLGRRLALGFLKRGFQEPGTRLEARGDGSSAPAATVEIVPLPFR